jgi:glutathione S-transferase
MKLYRLDYSCYARKAQMVLDLLGLRYECIDVSYGDREEMAALTGGYVQVPVLVNDGGEVTVDSRAICEKLLQGEDAQKLVPSPWQGPIWAYSDWCDGQLEDVTFRIAAGPQSRRLTSAWERSLYVFIKERKFGKGCVAEWDRCRDDLLARARALLAPTRQTLQRQRFVFGERATLADAALYGQLIMLDVVEPGLPAKLGPEFPPWMKRIEDARP